jgi:hypothetical protein
MNILWIGKRIDQTRSGEAILDERLIDTIRRHGHLVTVSQHSRVSSRRFIYNILSGLPVFQSRYYDEQSSKRIAADASSYDCIVCSWEYTHALVSSINVPTVFLLHNVSSLSITDIYSDRPLLSNILARFSARWERLFYGARSGCSLVTISYRDNEYLARLIHTDDGLSPMLAV